MLKLISSALATFASRKPLPVRPMVEFGDVLNAILTRAAVACKKMEVCLPVGAFVEILEPFGQLHVNGMNQIVIRQDSDKMIFLRADEIMSFEFLPILDCLNVYTTRGEFSFRRCK